jgi:hypothetical protein
MARAVVQLLRKVTEPPKISSQIVSVEYRWHASMATT